MSLTKEEIEKICAENIPMKLYHLWLPEELYNKVRYMADVEKKTLNRILVDCIKVALE